MRRSTSSLIFLFCLGGLPATSCFCSISTTATAATNSRRHTVVVVRTTPLRTESLLWPSRSGWNSMKRPQYAANIILLQESPSGNIEADPAHPLCDLQTFLRMTELVESGGQAKTAIQAGECYLNGVVETRRAKKLFPGDKVAFKNQILDVSQEVLKRGYVYKPKKKKTKPVAKVDEDGNLEFGGKFRSEEWREERKKKKAERKAKNSKA